MSTLGEQRVAVLLGGNAAERSVSLESGANVAATLREFGGEVIEVDTADAGWIERLAEVDFVFNLLHGPGGEDGCVQGVCELLGLPYSGSGVSGAALTMDKVLTKRLWREAGLPTPPFAMLDAGSDWQALIDTHTALFVKPAREGSSLGMARADNAAALRAAWEAAVPFGHRVFAEQLVTGDEYTVAILNGVALPSIRIEPRAEFYDFEAKYVSDETGFYCPSGLSVSDEATLADLAERAFATTGAAVWGRVDVMRQPDGNWQLLEVNTVPGMTSHSLVPMAARAAGLSMADLLVAIWQGSLEVHRNG